MIVGVVIDSEELEVVDIVWTEAVTLTETVVVTIAGVEDEEENLTKPPDVEDEATLGSDVLK